MERRHVISKVNMVKRCHVPYIWGDAMLFQGRYYEETPCSSLCILQIVEYVLEVMPVLFGVTSAIVGEGGIVKC